MSGLANPATWFVNWVRDTFGSGESKVTAESMLRIAAVWYAINKIAGGIAQMPIDIKWRLDQGADDYKTHPWWSRVRGRVNGYQTADVFKEQMQGHSLAWGNGRAAIVGSPNYELIPMMPDKTMTFLIQGEKYHVCKPDAQDRLWTFQSAVDDAEELKAEMIRVPQDVVVLHDRDVLHVQGFGYDGITGKAIYDVARDSMGIDLQANAYQNKQLKKGFAGQIMLTAPAGVFTKQEDAEKFLKEFRKTHELSEDAESIGLLRQGITAQVLAANARDSQMVERLKFSRQDVMLWFGLESMPGDDSPRGGYNGLEQLNLGYLINCLNRWIVKWEMQLNCKLRTTSEIKNDRMFFKFNTATLLRMDFKTTMETLGNAVTHTILSPDEARDKIDMKPRADGMGGRYVNPAIATDRPSQNGKPDAIAVQLDRLMKIEADRVLSACKSDNFVDAIDKFYVRWRGVISDAVIDLGDNPAEAIEDMNNRKRIVINIAGAVSTKDELAVAVKTETDHWKPSAALITT